ncbi:hypothetical protein GIB67_004666, partial [Kingdonia uniflora]
MWIHHGEQFIRPKVNVPTRMPSTTDVGANTVKSNDEDNSHAHNDLEEIAKYKKLIEDATQPLYPSCREEDMRLADADEL